MPIYIYINNKYLLFMYGGGGGLVAKLCPTLMTPWTVACQAPLSMGILQARILEWVAISFSRDLPDPGTKPRSSALAGRFFTI